VSIHNFDRIFGPNSIAVIGGNEKEETIGHSLIFALAIKYIKVVTPAKAGIQIGAGYGSSPA
jgi:acyl-CoA synthetase (NDP forming)